MLLLLPNYLIALTIFILGVLIGGFLNVCIYRIPRHISVVFPNSFCPNCKKTLKPQDRFPLIGFILVGGRCRFCKKPISWRYPAVELLTGLLFLFSFWKYNLSLVLLKNLIFISLLIVIAFIDISHQIIPNALSIPGIVIGLLFSIVIKSPNISDTLLATVAFAVILWIFRQVGLLIKKQEMMGWGDIKLAGMLGANFGIKTGLVALFISVIIGVVVWLILMLFKIKSRKDYIPFGSFMAIGAILTSFWGQNIIDWYLNLFAVY
ncbi:MAG: prepilin peptidase [candidate division WOR-3 bacterium]